MNIVFFGKDKSWSVLALEYLIGKKVPVKLVITPDEKGLLAKTADQVNIPVTNIDDVHNVLYDYVEDNDFDVGISYLYPKKLSPYTFNLPKLGTINFHSAPLPQFRGVGGINFAILESLRQWGVTAHLMVENVDAGPILKVKRFAVDCTKETALSLDILSQNHLFQLYMEVIDNLLSDKKIHSYVQHSGGKYISKEDFEKARIIKKGDSEEMIERRQRAFYYLGYEGAYEA